MPQDDIEKIKSELLHMLRNAQKKGLSKAKLKLKSKIRQQAFQDLLHEQKIANMGTPQKTRFVAMGFFFPLEEACDQILSKAPAGPIRAYTAKQLTSDLRGAPGQMASKAVKHLISEKSLLPIQCSGRTYLLHASVLLEKLGLTAPPSQSRDLEKKLIEAYQVVVSRTGFPNIRIFHLQQESGISMAEVKKHLMEMAREGRAVFSQGDWSLSSEEIRSGAVEIHHKPYLMVRLYL